MLRGECICIEGYGFKNGLCVDCGPCSQVNPFNYKCECAPTYYLIDGVCGTCPVGSVYNSNSQTCSISCPSNSQYNELLGQCVCFSGYHMDLINNRCIRDCPEGQRMVNKECKCINPNQVLYEGKCHNPLTCPPNSYFNPITFSCLCNQGYRLINNNCVSINCGPNSHNLNGICICNTGYYLINGQCKSCNNN